MNVMASACRAHGAEEIRHIAVKLLELRHVAQHQRLPFEGAILAGDWHGARRVNVAVFSRHLRGERAGIRQQRQQRRVADHLARGPVGSRGAVQAEQRFGGWIQQHNSLLPVQKNHRIGRGAEQRSQRPTYTWSAGRLSNRVQEVMKMGRVLCLR